MVVLGIVIICALSYILYVRHLCERVEICMGNGDTVRALVLLRKVPRNYSEYAVLAYEVANFYIDSGDFARAGNILDTIPIKESVLKLDVNMVYYIGRAYYDIEMYDKASECFAMVGNYEDAQDLYRSCFRGCIK